MSSWSPNKLQPLTSHRLRRVRAGDHPVLALPPGDPLFTAIDHRPAAGVDPGAPLDRGRFDLVLIGRVFAPGGIGEADHSPAIYLVDRLDPPRLDVLSRHPVLADDRAGVGIDLDDLLLDDHSLLSCH